MTRSTSQTIEITVKPDGSTSLETRGFTGSERQAASRFLEQALGATAFERSTSDFHQSVAANQQTTQQW